MSDVDWQRLDGEGAPARWDAILAQATDANAVQAYPWGEHRRAAGWTPERWVALRDARPLCAMQVLRRRVAFGRSLAWVPGGPLIGFGADGPAGAGTAITSWLHEERSARRLLYVRFYCLYPGPVSALDAGTLCAPPVVALNSGYTVQIDLTRSAADVRMGMTAKHRYYVKQAERVPLDWKSGSTDDLLRDFLFLHGEMSRAKTREYADVDPGEAAGLLRHFGDDCLILVGYQDGRPVTSCLVLLAATSALYMFAATNAAGRAVSAGYAMMPRLWDALRFRGVTRFDFGGIAPDSPDAAGVDHFKRGFGGTVVRYVGEWEWAASRVAAWLANRMFARRRTA